MPDRHNHSQPLQAEIVLPAGKLADTLDFFIDELGFRLDSIMPAEAPVRAQISGYGMSVCLLDDYDGDPGTLCLRMPVKAENQTFPDKQIAPNGTVIRYASITPEVSLPSLRPSRVIQHLSDASAWTHGRAGMLYRDLIPDRQGGRFIASHIRIPAGGPVADNVHFHHVRFQLIYCYRGWVRLVYEGQGEPFVMRAGDCVLQPPLIRHRVLEASDGLEVIEVGGPAEHMTCLDYDMQLPGPDYSSTHDFNGQQYQFFQASDTEWRPAYMNGFESCDLGIAAATEQTVTALVLRPAQTVERVEPVTTHNHELAFWFVLQGAMQLINSPQPATQLSVGDSMVIPAGSGYGFRCCSDDLRLLEITVTDSGQS